MSATPQFTLGRTSVQLINGPSKEMWQALAICLNFFKQDYAVYELTIVLPGKRKLKKVKVTFYAVSLNRDNIVEFEASLAPSIFSRECEVTGEYDYHSRTGVIYFD